MILTAIAPEARAIASALKLPCPRPDRPSRNLDAAPIIELHLVGIGAKNLPTGSGDPPVCAVIMAGVAGALDPNLQVGDLVLDDCPDSWVPVLPFNRGGIACSQTIVSAPQAKHALREQTGSLAVDMESSSARSLAAKLGAEFISIRAISDSADQSLDPAVLHLVNDFGQMRPGAVARLLLTRPQMIPPLMKLGEATKLATGNMAAAVAALVHRIATADAARIS